MKDAHKMAPSPIRLPADLKIWLKHKAVDNGRSLNSEVLFRLQESRRREEENVHARA